jgi:hypothetical protein
MSMKRKHKLLLFTFRFDNIVADIKEKNASLSGGHYAKYRLPVGLLRPLQRHGIL